MISGTFIGSCECPQVMGYQMLDAGLIPQRCQRPCNIYDMGSGSLTSICSGSDGVQHQQFFGPYYLDSVTTGSDPAW